MESEKTSLNVFQIGQRGLTALLGSYFSQTRLVSALPNHFDNLRADGGCAIGP
jgi:hypothetical protein